MYDLHRLRLLRELSHRGTLAAVADALGYSPSAVSRQLGVLEREVGVRLLEPAGRSVRLTPAARRLVSRTERVVRELEQAEAEIARMRTDLTGVIRVATFQTAAHGLVLDAIARLQREHPRLIVEFTHLEAEAAIPALLARDFDLVLSEQYPGSPPAPHPGLTTSTLVEDPLLLAVPIAWEATSLAELTEAPWVMEPAHTAPPRLDDGRLPGGGFRTGGQVRNGRPLLARRDRLERTRRGFPSGARPHPIAGDATPSDGRTPHHHARHPSGQRQEPGPTSIHSGHPISVTGPSGSDGATMVRFLVSLCIGAMFAVRWWRRLAGL